MRPIPGAIKSEIIRKYLEGDSIPDIHKMLGVSIGTISTIASEESRNDEFFSYMREIAKKFKSNNLGFSDVISGVRLYNKINKLGLTCPFFENFLESTDKESFRLVIDHDNFLAKINNILQFEKKYQLNIEDIPTFIKDAKEELDANKKKIFQINESLYSHYGVKEAEIQEYLMEKPKLIRSANFAKISLPTHIDWIVISDRPFKRASRKSGIKIDPSMLYKKLNSIYKNPDKHIEIIKEILDLPIIH
ncbi:MAG: helix-turn-helix domain-containing protein [Nitrososphaeraceae archaeon]